MYTQARVVPSMAVGQPAKKKRKQKRSVEHFKMRLQSYE